MRRLRIGFGPYREHGVRRLLAGLRWPIRFVDVFFVVYVLFVTDASWLACLASSAPGGASHGLVVIGGGAFFDGFFFTFMVFTVLVDFFVLTVPSGCLPATVVARQLDSPPPALVAGVGLYVCTWSCSSSTTLGHFWLSSRTVSC